MSNDTAGRRGILLADDDSAVRKSIRELLVGDGFTDVLEADTGLQALEILHREARRLAFSIMDVDMPGMSGIEVIRAVRQAQVRQTKVGQTPPGLPCILVSGNASRDRQVQAMEAGAFSLLSKPITPDLLRFSVQRLLDHHYGTPPL